MAPLALHRKTGMSEALESVEMPEVTPGPLSPMAQATAAALCDKGQTVAVFESTAGGLIQAALQSVPGASAYTTCGAVTYHSSRAVAVLGCDMSAPRPTNVQDYVKSKQELTAKIARRMREEAGADWCLSESGACGPSFNVPGISVGFSVITVTGPIERSILVQSTHARREDNMWGFAKAALDLLEDCIRKTDAVATSRIPEFLHFAAKEDRYGGIEAEVLPAASDMGAVSFQRALKQGVETWLAAGKRGLWLKVPLECAHFVGAARDEGFEFHHAKPGGPGSGYVELTRWLPASLPSSLPLYAFTQIGVGGVVVNRAGQVLMVQERVSPLPLFQGSWKLPGGLADPGEDFADTVAREVLEETGVQASLVGLVSMRHSHGFRFGQGDLYVLVKLAADRDDIKMDPHELQDARWMSPDTIRSLVASPQQAAEGLDGKVSESNWRMIDNALHGALILGQALPHSRGPRPSMLYTAATAPPAAL